MSYKTADILNAGYTHLADLTSMGAFYELRRVAITHNTALENVTAFRLETGYWAAFRVPSPVEGGFRDVALLPTLNAA